MSSELSDGCLGKTWRPTRKNHFVWVEYQNSTVTYQDFNLTIDFTSLVLRDLQYVAWAFYYISKMTNAPIRVLQKGPYWKDLVNKYDLKTASCTKRSSIDNNLKYVFIQKFCWKSGEPYLVFLPAG